MTTRQWSLVPLRKPSRPTCGNGLDRFDINVARLAAWPMRAKWASCWASGHLNFSEDLLDLDRDLWDYVIVHELLHFSLPNHGKLWKSPMRAHPGDRERLEKRLNRQTNMKHRSK